MSKDELLSKLSLEDDGRYKRVMLDGNQLGFEDSPGVMLMGFSDEDLVENAEIPEEEASAIQEHESAIREWVERQGFRVEI